MSIINSNTDLTLTAATKYTFYASGNPASLYEDNGSGYVFVASLNPEGVTYQTVSGAVRIIPSGSVTFNYHLGERPSVTIALAVTSSDVTLTWSDFEGDMGYEIQRSLDKTIWTTLTTTAPNDTEYVDSTVSEGVAYYYRIRPTAPVGAAWSGVIGVTTPTASTDLTLNIAVLSSTEITVSWNDLAGDQAYEVERKLGAGAFANINTTANNVTSYADTGLTASSAYTYRVKPVGGTYSNEVSGTTPASGGGASCALDPIVITNKVKVGSNVTFDAEVTGSSHGDTFSFDTNPVSGPGQKAYAQVHSFSVADTNFPLTLVATDVDDVGCQSSIIIEAPAGGPALAFAWEGDDYVSSSNWTDQVEARVAVLSAGSPTVLADWQGSGKAAVNFIPSGGHFLVNGSIPTNLFGDGASGYANIHVIVARNEGFDRTVYSVYNNASTDSYQWLNNTNNKQLKRRSVSATESSMLLGSTSSNNPYVLAIRQDGSSASWKYKEKAGSVLSGSQALGINVTADKMRIGTQPTIFQGMWGEIAAFRIYNDSGTVGEFDAIFDAAVLEFGF